jgi:hypothetical protein
MYNELRIGEFRALSVLQCHPLMVRLETLDFNKSPRYAALSYTWGSAPYNKGRPRDSTYQIVVNGVTWPVQQNLHDALEHLSSKIQNLDIPLFVDAICINQADMNERASQVCQMREIYENAELVVGWLGVPFDERETQLAVAQMQRFHQVLRSQNAAEGNNVYNVPLATSPEDETLFPRKPDSPTYTAWMGINEMFNAKYWLRAWIMQEATGPAKTWFYCGPYRFDKVQLSATVYFGHLYSGHVGANLDFVRNIGMGGSAARLSGFRELDGSFPSGRSRSTRLIDLCQSFRNTKSTDSRDKVYAPRNLATDLNASQMSPDYTRSTEQVYTDLAKLYLQKDGNLDFLGFVVHPAPDSAQMHGESQNVYTPSWVPDWSNRITVRPLVKTRDSTPTNGAYNACGGLQGNAPVVDGSRLLVQCYRVDEISRLSFICEQVDAKVLRSWMVGTLGNDYSCTGEIYEEAFSTSVVADLRYDPMGKCYSRGGKMIWSGEQPQTRENLMLLESSHVPLSNVCLGRRFAHTCKGLMGVVPAAAAIGDIITVISHSSVPLVLKHVSDSHYRLVGECYIHGIMDGKAIGQDVEWEAIVLE